MPNIKIYPIRSLMSHGDFISNDSQTLLVEIEKRLPEFSFSIIDDLKTLSAEDLVLILVQSGGSEGIFKDTVYSVFPGPYYLLTYGSSNSLAASLEIISFLRQNQKKGEVLHGNYDYIAGRIQAISKANAVPTPSRLGVLGKPSDWLISSDVDKELCKAVFNIDLVDIPEEEVLAAIEEAKEQEDSSLKFDPKEIGKALRIHAGLETIVSRHHLDGFTLRCFDILGAFHSSSCLSLALWNQKGVVASCEGDVPAMLTAFLIMKRFGYPCFQANPQWIDPVANEVEFAHCTLSLQMAKSYVLDTHFESGIGVGIHGEMKEGPITVVKIDASLKEFYCEEGILLENAYRRDRCRTQIRLKMNAPVSYFLTSSLGNHHQILYGHHKEKIKEYFQSLGLRAIQG